MRQGRAGGGHLVRTGQATHLLGGLGDAHQATAEHRVDGSHATRRVDRRAARSGAPRAGHQPGPLLRPGQAERLVGQQFLVRRGAGDLGHIDLPHLTNYFSSAFSFFSIDTLKIDQSFVRDVTTDADDASIVTAIIAMGHGLQLKVIAEGVETSGQLDFLRHHDCDGMQGFLFSRPQPEADITRLLQSGKRL